MENDKRMLFKFEDNKLRDEYLETKLMFDNIAALLLNLGYMYGRYVASTDDNEKMRMKTQIQDVLKRFFPIDKDLSDEELEGMLGNFQSNAVMQQNIAFDSILGKVIEATKEGKVDVTFADQLALDLAVSGEKVQDVPDDELLELLENAKHGVIKD